jgi:hypothetical protein
MDLVLIVTPQLLGGWAYSIVPYEGKAFTPLLNLNALEF